MSRLCTPEKCLSDPNLNQDRNDETTHALVNPKNKRKRREYYSPEFDAFKEEIKELIESWMKQHDSRLGKITSTLEGIHKTNSDIEASISFLNNQYDEIKGRVEKIEKEKKKEQEHIQLLEEKIEDLQRNARKTSLELRNVPSSKSENQEQLRKYFLTLTKSINVEINKNDIRDIYRVNSKQNAISPIVIELSSVSLKTGVLQATKSYNRMNKNNKLNASHLGFEKNNSPIFLAEQLTAKANRLYFLARGLIKTKTYKFCWTANGKVFIRKNENSPIVRITNEAQIQKLGSEE